MFVTRKNAVAGVIGEVPVGLNLTWLAKLTVFTECGGKTS